jgi:3-oxoacyl-[acyl-carrier protein] reductase
VSKALQEKVAVVTGAARGIGHAIAGKLIDQGATAVLADIDGEAAETSARELRTRGESFGVSLDVGSSESVDQMMAQLDAVFGRVDILVNNAGIGVNAPFLEMTADDWARCLQVNLTGAFLVGQAVAREMVRSGDGGAIVNIVSIAGQRGSIRRAAYGSSKAGLELLTRVMAVELASHDIRVNAIAPGPIASSGPIDGSDTEVVAYTNRLPMRCYGTPEDVAAAAAFLVSDQSRYVTGHTLNVDGGFAAAGLMLDTAQQP